MQLRDDAFLARPPQWVFLASVTTGRLVAPVLDRAAVIVRVAICTLTGVVVIVGAAVAVSIVDRIGV